MLFRVHLNMYLDNFKEIKFVSPNQDYDAYCDYVKENDKMNNFTLFLIENAGRIFNVPMIRLINNV